MSAFDAGIWLGRGPAGDAGKVAGNIPALGVLV